MLWAAAAPVLRPVVRGPSRALAAAASAFGASLAVYSPLADRFPSLVPLPAVEVLPLLAIWLLVNLLPAVMLVTLPRQRRLPAVPTAAALVVVALPGLAVNVALGFLILFE